MKFNQKWAGSFQGGFSSLLSVKKSFYHLPLPSSPRIQLDGDIPLRQQQQSKENGRHTSQYQCISFSCTFAVYPHFRCRRACGWSAGIMVHGVSFFSEWPGTLFILQKEGFKNTHRFMFIADITDYFYLLMDTGNYEDNPDSMSRGKVPLFDDSICKTNCRVGKSMLLTMSLIQLIDY